MRLTREQVRHVAELAKLKLTEEEVGLFQEQLSSILEHVDRLAELETDSIPPTAGVLPLRNVMRRDEPRPAFPREDMLANAPEVEDAFVKVKPILDPAKLSR